MSEMREALIKTIEYCIENGILSEYLKTRRKEVENLIFDLYTEEELDMLMKRDYYNEGMEEGMAKGKAETLKHTARLMKSNGISLDIISKITGLSLEEVEDIN